LSLLLDTSVVIPLRDGDGDVWARAMALEKAPFISILTVAELEGGVYRDPAHADRRRAALDALDGKLDVIPFDEGAYIRV
jgi:tRNA(fMet)-specific endonuclease VapC